MIHSGDDWSLISGECVSVLRKFGANRFDALVTDPPYELGFMGKRWDSTGIAYSVDLWREALRVLKPGAFLLAFGGTRTAHRMVCAIEDAGFEVRDSIEWIYGTGFPKSLNLGEGRGTALKPAHEPVCLAMKPIVGTFAANVAAHGTGALNVDAARIGTSKRVPSSPGIARHGNSTAGDTRRRGNTDGSGFDPNVGRWPANVLLDEQTAHLLDEQTAHLKEAGTLQGGEGRARAIVSPLDLGPREPWAGYGDSGGASRFFYVAKPGRKERDLGCSHLAPKSGGEATHREDGSAGVENPRAGAGRGGGARNYHPTVKPIALMRYLVRLVTPPGGTVLDPFTGSGTTGVAARLESRQFVGIERERDFVEIARSRIAAAPEFEP